MWHGGKNLFGETMAQQERSFLITRWTTTALSAGKCDEKFGAAFRTADSGESLLQVSALEAFFDRKA